MCLNGVSMPIEFITCANDLPTNPNVTITEKTVEQVCEIHHFTHSCKIRVCVEKDSEAAFISFLEQKKLEESMSNMCSTVKQPRYTQSDLENLEKKVQEYVILGKYPEKEGDNWPGFGLFAKKDISKGVRFPYVGEIKKADDADNSYVFTNDSEYCIDANEFGSLARFMQHLPENDDLQQNITFLDTTELSDLAIANMDRSVNIVIDEKTKKPIGYVYILTTVREIKKGEMLGYSYNITNSLMKSFTSQNDIDKFYYSLFTKTGKIIDPSKYYYNTYKMPHPIQDIHVSKSSSTLNASLDYVRIKSMINNNQQIIISATEKESCIGEEYFYKNPLNLMILTIKNKYNDHWQPHRGFCIGKIVKDYYLLTLDDIVKFKNTLQEISQQVFGNACQLPSFEIIFEIDYERLLCVFKIPTSSFNIEQKNALQITMQLLSMTYHNSTGGVLYTKDNNQNDIVAVNHYGSLIYAFCCNPDAYKKYIPEIRQQLQSNNETQHILDSKLYVLLDNSSQMSNSIKEKVKLLNQEGMEFYKAKQYDRAMASFKKALRLLQYNDMFFNEEIATLHFSVGAIDKLQGNHESACLHLNMSHQLRLALLGETHELTKKVQARLKECGVPSGPSVNFSRNVLKV